MCIINVPTYWRMLIIPSPTSKAIPRTHWTSSFRQRLVPLSYGGLHGWWISSSLTKGVGRSLINWICENCSRGKSDRGLLFQCPHRINISRDGDEGRLLVGGGWMAVAMAMMMKWGLCPSDWQCAYIKLNNDSTGRSIDWLDWFALSGPICCSGWLCTTTTTRTTLHLPYCHAGWAVVAGERNGKDRQGNSTGNREFITFRRPPFIKFAGNHQPGQMFYSLLGSEGLYIPVAHRQIRLPIGDFNYFL